MLAASGVSKVPLYAERVRKMFRGLMSANTRLCRLAVLTAAFLAPLTTLAATPSPDAQLWSEADFIGSLSKETTLTGIAIARVGQSVANPTLTALGLQLDRKVGHWTFGVSYRHEVVRHSTGGPSISQLALAVATYEVRWDRSTIAVRGRVDDTLHSTGNPWRFRIRPEYRWATQGFGPISYLFVNDEVFYQGSAGEWSRNRAQVGLGLALGRTIDLQTYYQWQHDRIGSPARINALGLHLDVHLQ